MILRTVCYCAAISVYNDVVVTAFLSHPQSASTSISTAASTSISKISTPITSSTSRLNMNNSHRARVEKNLEDMMGNDWRMFRAQLVAEELAEKRNKSPSEKSRNTRSIASSSTATATAAFLSESESSNSNSRKTHSNSKPRFMEAFGEPVAAEVRDEKQARQEKFGNIFAAIFSNHNSNNNEKKKEVGANSHRHYSPLRSIFDGHNVGGATPDSMIPDVTSGCEDPFVSEAELPAVLLNKPKVQVDKNRWAHSLSHIEPGCVLIANEKLGGVFHQTVVLIIEHNEGAGSTGIVINRPLAGNLLKTASETKSNVDLSLKLAFNSATVTYGGPVLQEEYSVLHGYGNVDGSKKVAPGVFVGGSEELMKEVRRRNLHPNDALFVKGHAAWVPNQLAREISKGVWYTASCSSDFLLRYASGAPPVAVSEDDDNENEVDLWSDILTCMGEEYADIAKKHGGKGDMRMT